MGSQVHAQLNSQKEHVQELQRSITANKTIYSQTLRSLEQISEEIHEARRCRQPREPGVGAELIVPTESDTSNLQRHSSAMNLYSALEEQTAQEEKYWESLREKLEEMQTSDKETVQTETKEISKDFLDSRQRSLTGSSDAEEDLERVVSGDSRQRSLTGSSDVEDNLERVVSGESRHRSLTGSSDLDEDLEREVNGNNKQQLLTGSSDLDEKK